MGPKLRLRLIPLREILDDLAVAGPIGELSAGLRYARPGERGLVLALPCDAPFLRRDLLMRLRAGLEDGRGVAVGSSDALYPVCGLWRTDVVNALPDYLATGQRSLRRFALGLSLVEVPWSSEPHDPFMNINGPGDLAGAENLLRS